MARGRFLSKSVSTSETLHRLPDDTCRLVATWIIPHLDKNGVMYGDPELVRSTVVPWRTEISMKQMRRHIKAMVDVGYAHQWECSGRTWLWFPAFEGEQQGLRPEREKTRWPSPPDACRIAAGFLPATARENPATARENPATAREVAVEDQDQVQDQDQDQVQHQHQGQEAGQDGDGDGGVSLDLVAIRPDVLDGLATLLDLGVTETRAHVLAAKHSLKRIQAWSIYATKKDGIRDPAAYAITQLESNTRPPPEAYQWAAEQWG